MTQRSIKRPPRRLVWRKLFVERKPNERLREDYVWQGFSHEFTYDIKIFHFFELTFGFVKLLKRYHFTILMLPPFNIYRTNVSKLFTTLENRLGNLGMLHFSIGGCKDVIFVRTIAKAFGFPLIKPLDSHFIPWFVPSFMTIANWLTPQCIWCKLVVSKLQCLSSLVHWSRLIFFFFFTMGCIIERTSDVF